MIYGASSKAQSIAKSPFPTLFHVGGVFEGLRWFSYWGWGFGLDRWRLPPLKVVVSTRLTPWEAGVRSGEGSDLQTELERRVESVRELAARERGETVRSSVSVGEEYHFPIRS